MPEVTSSAKERAKDSKVPDPVTAKSVTSNSCKWKTLPYEIWMIILVDHGVAAEDLVALEKCCRWFSIIWATAGMPPLPEECARLIVKRHKRKIFGEFVKTIQGSTWKEKLYRLELLEKSQQKISAGSYQNIFISNGSLLTWGAGKFGQLGNARREDSIQLQDIKHFVPAESGEPTQVSAGCGHSGFVTLEGHAYTCGDNRYNQLGHTNFQGKHCPVPTRVGGELVNKRCLQIACGSSHTLFLTDAGKVYVAGIGGSGQLGTGNNRGLATEPILVPFQYDDYKIVQIAVGIAHNILVSDCGKVFTFGLGSTGQLGHGGTKNIPQPTLISVLRNRKIRYAAAGVSHSIFIDSEGKAYTCGKGNGLLGQGDSHLRTVPVQVLSLQGLHIVSAAAGVTQSIFIDSNGSGYWCGEGMGELKGKEVVTPTKMELPEPLKKASIGNSHIILQMKSGRLMAVGNNSRYQTGIITEQETNIVPKFTYVTELAT